MYFPGKNIMSLRLFSHTQLTAALLLGILLSLPECSWAQRRTAQNEGITIDDRLIATSNEGFTSPESNASVWSERSRVKGAHNETLLETDVHTNAPDLLITSQLKGWYRIYVGIYTPDNLTCGLFIKGTNEPGFTFIKAAGSGPFPAFSETFYKNLDMTGQSIVVRQPLEYRSYLDYIRLVPLDDGERQKMELLQQAPFEKEILGIADFWRWFYFFGSYDPENPAICVREHADYGINILVYELGRSCTSYNTKIGTPYYYDSARPRTRIVRFQTTRNTPLRTSVEAAHQAGIKIYGRLGMNCHYGTAYRGTETSNFAASNPDFWERNKNGTPNPDKLCYAFKQVRQERIDLFLEALDCGVDGLFLDVLRYPPMVEYGQPVVDAYMKVTGIDPRGIDSLDTAAYKQWLKFRSEYFTLLMRELRAALQKKNRENIPVVIRISDEGLDKNLEDGVDLATIVRDQLATGIVAFGDRIGPYLDLVKGTDIKVYGGCSVHGDPLAGPEHHSDGAWPSARYASPDARTLGMNILDLYERGAHGVALDETDEGVNYPELRPFFPHLRSTEMLKEFLKQPLR